MTTTKKYIIPFKVAPKPKMVTIGNQLIESMGTIELPSLQMLTSSEESEVEAAKIWNYSAKMSAIAKFAKTLYDAESLKNPDTAKTFSEYDLIIREMLIGYQSPVIPQNIEDVELFLNDHREKYDKKLEEYLNAIADYYEDLQALSKQISQEEDRVFEVYAVVMARHRMGLEGITYSELKDSLQSPRLLFRIGLFGKREHDQTEYDDRTEYPTEYPADDNKLEIESDVTAPKPLMLQTDAELVKP
jgi:hypothetical protein